MGRVTMYHSGSDRYQDASKDAFDRVWSLEGWEIADQEEAPVAAKADEKKPSVKKRASARKGADS